MAQAWPGEGHQILAVPRCFVLLPKKFKLFESLITKSLKFADVLPQENNCALSCRRGGEEKHSFRSAANVNFGR